MKFTYIYYAKVVLVAAFISVSTLMWNAYYNVFQNTDDLLVVVSISWGIAFCLTVMFPGKIKEK